MNKAAHRAMVWWTVSIGALVIVFANLIGPYLFAGDSDHRVVLTGVGLMLVAYGCVYYLFQVKGR